MRQMEQVRDPGTLFIVATPIGNLDDMTPRACKVLSQVDVIAAEDTRHSRPLLDHYGIGTPLLALHEHNEEQRSQSLLNRIQAGDSVALISDAGTPLISDPGYRLVRLAHQRGIKVVPLPGPCAMIAALSVAALPTDRFCFEGFLPAKGGNRRAKLEALRGETRTLIFYESPHRIIDSLTDMVAILGEEREATVAREITKCFETIRFSTLAELLLFVTHDHNQQKGEFVVMIAGAAEIVIEGMGPEVMRIAEILATELPVKQAASLTSQICGGKKREIYQYLIAKNSEAQR